MQNKVLILDFGSQYTQLIARRVRELNIYCEIHPFNNPPKQIDTFKAVILSGSPFSVRGDDAPHPDLAEIPRKKFLCLEFVMVPNTWRTLEAVRLHLLARGNTDVPNSRR